MYWIVHRISRKQENTVLKMGRRQRQPEMLKRPHKKNSWFKMLPDDAHTVTNTIATTALIDTGHHCYYHCYKTTGHRVSVSCICASLHLNSRVRVGASVWLSFDFAFVFQMPGVWEYRRHKRIFHSTREVSSPSGVGWE